MGGSEPEAVAQVDGDRLLALRRVPGGADGVVEEHVGGAQRRLGTGHRRLRRRALGERSRGSLADLAGGQSHEVVDRGACVAERGGSDRQREEAEQREAVQRTVHDRTVEQGEHAGVGDEHLVGDAIVAARSAQAERVPGVLDLQVGLGKRDDAVLGPLVVGRRGIVDERAGEQDVSRERNARSDEADTPGRVARRVPHLEPQLSDRQAVAVNHVLVGNR